MTHPIDTAYVDIEPDQDSFKKLNKYVDQEMKKLEKGIEKHLVEVDKDFEDTFTEIDRHFVKMNDDAERRFRELEETISDSLDRTSKDIDRKFAAPVRGIFGKITETVGDLGRTFGQLGSLIGGAISSAPLLALIVALTPAVLALAAALSQLIGLVGLLPAGLAVLIGAILPLVLAFQNFGEAVSAVASGDLEKIDEALKKLSPSAAFVARELGRLMPLFREFQKTLQEAFFSQILGDLTKFTLVVLPALRSGMAGVAAAFGQLVHAFAGWATQQQTVQQFAALFASVATIIQTMTGPIVKLTGALLNVAVAALPVLESLVSKFGDLISRFSSFINASIADGSFDTFLQDALTTLREVFDLVGAVSGLIGTLFSALEGEGHTLLQTLTQIITQLDLFLQSEDGQMVLALLVAMVKTLGQTLMGVTKILIFFTSAFRQNMLSLGRFAEGIGEFFTTLWGWIKRIPEVVTEFLGSLPERVRNIFSTMFDNILTAIGVGIGLVLFALQVLPEQIGQFFMSLPERAYESFKSLITVVGDIITQAITFGKELLVNGFNDIVEFIRSVPGRIRDLIPNFASSGKSLIQSFMEGFRSVGSFIGDITGDIINSVKGFLNRAIDRINVGIAKLDDVLPGSLARIPRLAAGALVKRTPGGVLANIGEGPEDEAVLPLSKLEGMIKGGEQIVFGPGAIQLNFDGAMPTADEARMVGTAVAEGLIQRISQRNDRLQVRAV